MSVIYKVVIYAVFAIGMFASIKTCSDERDKRKIAEQNTLALASDIERYEDVNGKQVAVIAGLQLDVKSLEKINADLYEELEATNIKLKNATGAVKIVTEYKYIHGDTVVIKPVGDSVAYLSLDDEWLKLNVKIDTQSWVVKPNDLEVFVPNTIYYFTSIKTKGWWIFKKNTGVQVDVKNSNPHVQVSEGIYVDLTKK